VVAVLAVDVLQADRLTLSDRRSALPVNVLLMS
jgi:hypothetical protein